MKKLLILMFSLCAFLVNCAQKKSENIQPAGSFPNSLGNTFTYAVIDSVNNTSFNVQVAVIGTSKLENGASAYIWTYTYPNLIDTNYVVSNLDSAVFYNKSQTAITNVYHFPLMVGNKWRESFVSDSSLVINTSSITTPAGTFTNAFLINEIGHSPNYLIKRNQWFAPNIGMIKMSIYEVNLGIVTKQSWALTNYHIALM